MLGYGRYGRTFETRSVGRCGSLLPPLRFHTEGKERARRAAFPKRTLNPKMPLTRLLTSGENITPEVGSQHPQQPQVNFSVQRTSLTILSKEGLRSLKVEWGNGNTKMGHEQGNTIHGRKLARAPIYISNERASEQTNDKGARAHTLLIA